MPVAVGVGDLGTPPQGGGDRAPAGAAPGKQRPRARSATSAGDAPAARVTSPPPSAAPRPGRRAPRPGAASARPRASQSVPSPPASSSAAAARRPAPLRRLRRGTLAARVLQRRAGLDPGHRRRLLGARRADPAHDARRRSRTAAPSSRSTPGCGGVEARKENSANPSRRQPPGPDDLGDRLVLGEDELSLPARRSARRSRAGRRAAPSARPRRRRVAERSPGTRTVNLTASLGAARVGETWMWAAAVAAAPPSSAARASRPMPMRASRVAHRPDLLTSRKPNWRFLVVAVGARPN